MNMDQVEYRNKIEDEVFNIIDSWSRAKQRIAYFYLFNLGFRTEGIVFEIDRDLREEQKKTA